MPGGAMPVEIRMPELSKDMPEADLVSWLIKPGDRVRPGQLIAEIETDKSTVELEADVAGVVIELRVAAGSTGVKVGEILAFVEPDAGRDASEAASEPASDPAQPASATIVASVPEVVNVAPAPRLASMPDETRATTVSTDTTPKHDARSEARPAVTATATALARRLADQAGVALSAIRGSGPGGKIVKRDIEAAAPASSSSADPPVWDSPHVEVPHTRMRRTIAERLSQAKREVPHFYLRIECTIDRLLEVRRQLNSVDDTRISVNDFVIRALALALRAVPEAHVAWSDSAMLHFERADISVAVATDDGLVTPVVRGADRKGLADISAEMRSLAERARARKLRPDEYRGGTFTVSNLGMYGVESVTPILNPPQSGILGVGAGLRRPWALDDQVGIATVMVCTLAADHRALDGAAGARLLAAFRERIEDPLEMVL